MSKRLLLSRILQRSGALRLLEAMPSRPGILVVNHHRIGNPEAGRFDRGVFSQTAEGLDEQVALLKKRMPVIAGDELESLVLGKQPLKRTYAVLTFDDGYLDNYTLAFPVLRNHGVPAIFFPVIQYAGTNSVPWWDEIAYLVRNTTLPFVTVNTPEPLRVEMGEDREAAILQLLRHYKRPDNRDGEAFLRDLRVSSAVSTPDVGRRFLSWDEAREMAKAGMEFGSHTCSHTILSQQSGAEQRVELANSKRLIESELNCRVHSLAYPVGSSTAFTSETESIAADVGYTMAFSFQGGWNQAPMRQTNLNRQALSLEPELYRMEIASTVKRFA